MFRDLLGWAFRQADVTPTYEAQHCLAVRGGSCRACAEVCPHDAVTIVRSVTIEPVDCTGCGLCVAACPSFALTPRGAVPAEAAVRCSEVAGEASSVTCLARLQASDLLRLAGGGRPVTLARGDCATCDVGGPGVPAALERSIAAAAGLLEAHGRTLALEVVETDRLDVPQDRHEVSRRELLRGGWKGMRRTGGALLAPLERFAEAEDVPIDRRTLPVEFRRRFRAVELARPAPDDRVPLRLPEVLDGCILCPACARACPTHAIRRVFDAQAAGGARIELEADRCVGCDACVDACPVDVVRMRDDVTWAEFGGPPRTLYRADRPAAPLGAVTRDEPPAPSPTVTDEDAS